jgi:hypothetical protein
VQWFRHWRIIKPKDSALQRILTMKSKRPTPPRQGCLVAEPRPRNGGRNKPALIHQS